MSEYFSTGTITLDNFEDQQITEKYNQGYVLTRVAKGFMNQTRSLRIDLAKFELSSENRRILRKNEELKLEVKKLPIEDYTWQIHQMGKEFYTKKFGDGTMSAMKIKEMFSDMNKSNMTHAFEYHLPPVSTLIEGGLVGYCLAYAGDEIVHYAYPFYDLAVPKEQNLGLAMMTKAVLWAQENSKKYIYLGSVVDPESKYKLQFEGLEWWDNEASSWNQDLTRLKVLLS